MQDVYKYIDENWQEAIEDLKKFCAQPSISAQAAGIEETANMAAEFLKKYGVNSQVISTSGNPVVYGELKGESPYTLLFYNHYDVQPPEPLELWTTPPFEPVIDNDILRARGVSDDKGDIMARILAVKAFLETKGKLPISIKFLIEGEEEVGSVSLPSFIDEHKSLLDSDACFWESGSVSWDDRPEIVLGLKGIVCVELEARGAARDIHSSRGTIVPNPAWRLIWALNSIKDENENILIEGFYDNVRPPTEQEIEVIKNIPIQDKEFRESLGIDRFLKGLEGTDLQLYHIFQPACTINGLISGYTGEGSKTVLPCQARAKLDFRLVPNQAADEIIPKLRNHLHKNGFSDVMVTVGEGENPARTPLDSPFAKSVSEAAREAYGSEPIIKPTATGSGPMFSFTDTLGLPVASAGVGNPDSRAHAPDENIRLVDFVKGVKHVAAIMGKCSTER